MQPGHSQLGQFVIIEPLGEGGMGFVYKARDTRLDRVAAIKVLPADAVADPERQRRFAQEAKAASAFNHPNIVTIYEPFSGLDIGTSLVLRTLIQDLAARGEDDTVQFA